MILQRLLFLSVFFCGHSFYACEKSKSDEKPEIVDLTSSFHSLGLQLTVFPYEGVSNFQLRPRADGRGVYSDYHCIDPASDLYRKRQRAVEDFVATNPDDAAKEKYYFGAYCDQMEPARGEDFGPNPYCFAHHCYGYQCLKLYAYQAYLLQPNNVEKTPGSIHQIIHDEGKREVLRRMPPQSEYNFWNKVRMRAVGMKFGMK